MYYFVYVLKSRIDYKYYYGLTNNLERRLNNHNNKEVKSTKSRAPFDLIYYEKVDNIKEARIKEKYFKSGFGRKYIKNKIEYLALSSNQVKISGHRLLEKPYRDKVTIYSLLK
jgi:putative endonuclease